MSLVADIIARIEVAAPNTFAILAGAAEFAAIDTRPEAMPAVYVIVEEERAEENTRMTGPVLQRVEADIAVVIAAENVSDTTGGAVAGDIEELKAKVRKSLIGFVPPDSASGEPVTFLEGKLLKMRHGVAWDRELFGVSYYLGEEA